MTPVDEARIMLLCISDGDSHADVFEAIVDAAVPTAIDVVRAATVAEALTCLAHSPPDCAAVGVGPQDPEALEIVTTLAAASPAVALIALTATDDDEFGLAAIEAGASDYLCSTVLDGRLLARCVRHAMLRKRFELLLAEARNGQGLAEAALAHNALHDPLTGLANRILFLDRLGEALVRAGAQSSVCTICFDIDRFKVINDSLGYPVGDQLLSLTAGRLARLVRPGDTLARTGSDEFAVLCEGLTGQAEAVAVADRICAQMAVPLAWEGGELVVAVSAGIAFATSASTSPDSLLADAQAAVYRAKRAGLARSALFAPTMRSRAIGRLDTEVSLRQSILNGDLRLHYQPIVYLVDGQILGHEALVRWDHPTRGLLRPDDFIDVAEESGLIVPLGAWVMQEACRQARRFQVLDPRWERLTMSVNVSGRQLGQPDLIDSIAAALDDAGLRPEHLQLELTEGVLMDDAAATIGILAALKGLGVRLDVDDFGTGYSSLAYLKRFPIDVLKIDHAFVHDLGKDPGDAAIVTAVVRLADALGFTVIAEGVETALQRDCLVDLGCSRAQGYYFAHPVEAWEAENALDDAMGRSPRSSDEADPRATDRGPRTSVCPVAP